MNNTWFEIKWHFGCWGWSYIAAMIITLLVVAMWYIPASPLPPPTIKTVIEGTIVDVRATGAWENWCKIELTFEDGTVLLTSYWFIREYKIKKGRDYTIKDHSRRGRIAYELRN